MKGRLDMRKKWICLLLAGILALSLAACGGDDEDASASGSSEPVSDASGGEGDASDSGQAASDSADASAEPEDASGSQADGGESGASGADASGAEVGGDSAAPVAVAPARMNPGLYYNENEELYPFERAPYLELREDGTGVFRANTGFGELAEASGSWAMSGGSVVLTVEQLEAEESFYDDTQGQLVFSVLDDDNLMYAGGTYGLTHSGDVMTLEGAEVYTGPLPSQTPSPAPAPQGDTSEAVSGADGSSPDASDVSGEAGDSSDAPLEENEDGVPVVQPGELPPHRMSPGESFIVAGVDLESIVYDTAYFKMTPMADTGQALFTALQEGQTSVGYELVPFDGVDGAFTEYPIKIAETALGLTLVLAIAGGSLVVGGVLGTILFLFFKKRRDTKEERKLLAIEKKEQKKDAAQRKKEEKTAAAEIKADESAKKKQASADKKAVKAAQKQEKKAAKQAAVKEKKAHKVALKAEKAAKEADKAAEKAAKAAERVAQKAGKKAEADEGPSAQESPAVDDVGGAAEPGEE